MTEKEITITCAAGPLCRYYNMGSTLSRCFLKAATCQFQRPLIRQESEVDRKRVISEIREWAKEGPIYQIELDALCERIEKL